MSRSLSQGWHEAVDAVSGTDPILFLIEIDHPDLTAPIRVVSDSQDLVSNGNTFVAVPFRARLPDDLSQGLPRAEIEIDNVGKPPDGNSINDWLELSRGGAGATVRMMAVLASAPDTLEMDMTLQLLQVSVTPTAIRAKLGYTDIANTPAVRVQYRPDVTPGLF